MLLLPQEIEAAVKETREKRIRYVKISMKESPACLINKQSIQIEHRAYRRFEDSWRISWRIARIEEDGVAKHSQW